MSFAEHRFVLGFFFKKKVQSCGVNHVWAGAHSERDSDGGDEIAERERNTAGIGPGVGGRISIAFVFADEFSDVNCDTVSRASIDHATSSRGDGESRQSQQQQQQQQYEYEQ
jgi:hypothetical protein